jgi:selenocysteine lyase/cysteine desulfurase
LLLRPFGGKALAIYLNQAATSHPKPKAVYEAVIHALQSPEAAEEVLAKVKGALRKLFKASEGTFYLTPGGTAAAFLALERLLHPGDHVLVDPLVSSSIAGLVEDLGKRWGIDITWLKSSDPREAICALRPTTSLLIAAHACSITGRLLPVGELTRLARGFNRPVLVDATHSAGLVPLDFGELDLVAFSGHRGLLGPMGTGGLYVSKELVSKELSQHVPWPREDFFGTPNIPGLAGLAAGVAYLLAQGNEAAQRWESLLRESLGFLAACPGVKVYGGSEGQLPFLAFNLWDYPPEEVALVLYQVYDIKVDAGRIGTPRALQALGIPDRGAVRASFGIGTDPAEVASFLRAIRELSS